MSKRDRPIQADMTQQEVADALGTTRAAVADIEKRALRKLKRELEKRGFTMDDFFTYQKKRTIKI
jgi:transcriptional regulator